LRSSFVFRRCSSTSLAALCLALAIPAFAQSTPADLPDDPGTHANLPKPEPLPTGPTIVIDTTMGRFTCKTFADQAPLAVANFVGLAEGTRDWSDAANHKQHNKRFYDGLTFHRVIPEFMVQGGDPAGDGSGDPGYYFPNEVDPALIFSVPGRLAMANSGLGPDGKGTNGSQFFITEQAVSQLNGSYTIFGQCDDASVALVTAMARVPRNADDKPLTPVVITRVTIVRNGQPMPPAPAIKTPPVAAPTQHSPSEP
jgi:peptidyl-prolyl cis-trans isomerase A (cyclophilin A)